MHTSSAWSRSRSECNEDARSPLPPFSICAFLIAWRAKTRHIRGMRVNAVAEGEGGEEWTGAFCLSTWQDGPTDSVRATPELRCGSKAALANVREREP